MELKRVFRDLGLLIFCIFLAASGWLMGDVYLKQKRHTDAFEVMGHKEPAKDEVLITWMGSDRGRIDVGEDRSIIIRLDDKTMYFLDHTTMKYRKTPFGSLDEIVSQSLAGSDMSEEERAEAQKMMKGVMGMMKAEAHVTETGETKTINAWHCSKYMMETKMMMMEGISEIWATEDLDINYELYRSLGAPFTTEQPGFQQIFEEMKRIKGIPVMTISTSKSMGAEIKSTEELVEAFEKPAPAGTYDVPAGYSEEK